MGRGGTLPVFFRKSSELVGNYDFVDIATGRGRKTLYLHGTRISGSTTYRMDTLSIQGSGAVASTGTGMSKILDLDFDLKLKKRLVLDGDAICSFTIGYFGLPTTGVRDFYLVARIRRVNAGGVESEIAMNTSEKSIPVNGNSIASFDMIYTLPITLSNVIFNNGETLRLTIELWGLTSGGITTDGVRWCGAEASTAVLGSRVNSTEADNSALALLNDTNSATGTLIIPIVLDT